ncbi:mediator of RNA polymerase II transcription subunit 27 [Schistocerca gregaria]|uniref:mediator of RNA polymerase II transcription subunit 27 n=1 Tax=Schistocerca cancellata TaxID=274614 RepID=UPI002117FED6|nr:mediator of RNA polymerase II transcription subunit 27 [Schistocerca cancellata]XP_049859423.1 mediator of RNA polymerase II transcription subunit 27 [Schistocerca gregaria]
MVPIMAQSNVQELDRLIEPLYTALNSVKVLRSSVGHVFDTLGNGLRGDHGEEGKDNKFLLELQELLSTVNVNFREVEQAVNSLTPPPGPFSLGNTTFLSQESTQERQALYPQLVNSYKWTDKVHEYSNLAFALLSQNQLKRSYVIASSGKRRRNVQSSHNVLPQAVDTLIAGIDRQFADMNLTVSRPFGSNAVMQVTLGRIMKALVAFKGLMIEWVVVKGYTETLDLWTESRYKVFQKVTENAHAAMLHFHSPNLLEISVRSFMTWFHSYSTLFSDPCKRCGNHLHNALPPTWRDLRALEPYHEECKP